MHIALLLFTLLAQTDPTDAQGWFRLGITRLGNADYRGALQALEKAQELKHPAPVQLPLLVARAQARLGEKEKAFASLKTAIDAGYLQTDAMNAENDFLSLRDDKRWTELVAQARKNQHPCSAAPEFRQFDFWLGEWDVEANGAKTARSSIQLILDDCTIYENYGTLNNAYSGKSFSMWNASLKRWEQRYVDTQGSSSDWIGKLEGDAMVFLRTKDATSSATTNRMTYTKEGPDKVRQKVDVSTDDGKTWSTQFDGLYVRRK
ncbi:MAG TPA: hypothetical protein VMU84_17555 [Thermoanaerobaculia bacterium]|nr:hypothetical protein [Thermoanaerobaculia bacterium]